MTLLLAHNNLCVERPSLHEHYIDRVYMSVPYHLLSFTPTCPISFKECQVGTRASKKAKTRGKLWDICSCIMCETYKRKGGMLCWRMEPIEANSLACHYPFNLIKLMQWNSSHWWSNTMLNTWNGDKLASKHYETIVDMQSLPVLT